MATAVLIGGEGCVREPGQNGIVNQGASAPQSWRAGSREQSFAENLQLYSEPAVESSSTSTGMIEGRGRNRAGEASASRLAEGGSKPDQSAKAGGGTKSTGLKAGVSQLPAMRLSGASADEAMLSAKGHLEKVDRSSKKVGDRPASAVQVGSSLAPDAALLNAAVLNAAAIPMAQRLESESLEVAATSSAGRIAGTSAEAGVGMKNPSLRLRDGKAGPSAHSVGGAIPGAAAGEEGQSLVGSTDSSNLATHGPEGHLGAFHAVAPVLLAGTEAGSLSSAAIVQHGAVVNAGGLGKAHASDAERDHSAAGLNAREAGESGDQAVGAMSSLGEPHMLLASPHVLEVGITGGAHGWLRVRAELEHTGQVTASLVASSAGSADALQKQLGAISAYLKSESIGVTSLAVTAPERNGAMQLASGGSAGGSSAHGSASGEPRQSPEEAASRSNAREVHRFGPAGFGSGYSKFLAVPQVIGRSGSWLSVRV